MNKLQAVITAWFENRTVSYIEFTRKTGISDTFFYRLRYTENFSVAISIEALIQMGELPNDYDFTEVFEQSLETYFDGKIMRASGAVGLPASTFYAWRSGENIPLYGTLKKYCDYIGMDVYDFLKGGQHEGTKQEVSGHTGDNL